MISRRNFVRVSGASTAAIALPAMARATMTPTHAEATALIRFAEQTHPRGREARSDANWRKLAAELQAPGTIDQFVVRALALLAWFKDGHTTLGLHRVTQGPFGSELPIRISPFYDGLFVTEAATAYKGLLGAKLLKIGSTEVREVMQRFASVWPANNPAWPHHDAGLLLTTPGFLHGLGIVRGPDAMPIPIEVQLPGGQLNSRAVVPGAAQPRDRIARPSSDYVTWATAAGSGNFVRRLPDTRTLYVSLDDISQDVAPFLAFTKQIFAAMDEPDWERFVLDLRRNPGGNNFLGEPLRKHIERSRFNRPGGLYVLISPTTFSAAQNLSNRLERETFAIFAGEPTGGAPNHYGDAKIFASQLLPALVSSLPWFDSYPMDHRQWIMPDMLIPKMFADWAAGRDVVLRRVLSDHQTLVADDLSRERTFPFSRKSQAQEWKPFWMA